ncbi:MAG: SRPBCC domain-containing protein [Candidatus Palauibacterales bacterium]|nr:SRPBCC domain-containing protein [Candidatus Palauibacterales bacterium]
MGLRPDGSIRWRIHLTHPPDAVYPLLATPGGRKRFWADSPEIGEDRVEFRFGDGSRLESRILERDPPGRFVLTYFGGSRAEFDLADDGDGGTDVTLTERGVPETERSDNLAGWVSVLLGLKAAVELGADLRNHDPERSWDRDYVDV